MRPGRTKEVLTAVLALAAMGAVGAFVLRSSSLPGVLEAEARALQRVQGTRWFPYLEWSLTNPSWSGNPFDVLASATFVHQGSGEKRTTQMFHDGKDRWKFRFAGTRTGTWTFTTASADPDLNGKSGTMTIAPNPLPGARGFVTNAGGQWGWEGTERVVVPQFVMVRGKPGAYHSKPSLIDADIREFLHGHGFSGFHAGVVAGRWFAIDGLPRVSRSMQNPDPRTFEALEQLISRVHAAGGIVHLWAWGDQQRGQTPINLSGGTNGPEDRRLQRYIAARLGPLPGWTMGYGADLDEWVTASQLRSWRDYMHRHLGWAHLLGGRAAGPNSGTDHSAFTGWNARLDYSSYEHHKPSYEVYAAGLQAVPGQPVFSEDRFRFTADPARPKDYTPEETRRGLWHSTMAGGVANIWGNLTGGGSYEDGSAPYPNKQQLKTYAVFFNDKARFVKGMVPAGDLGDPGTRVLGRGSDQLVFYRENATSIRMDLSGMSAPQPAVAVDTKKAYREIPLGHLTATSQVADLPYSSDWAIAVGVFDMP